MLTETSVAVTVDCQVFFLTNLDMQTEPAGNLPVPHIVVQANGNSTSSECVYVTSDGGMLKASQDGAHAAGQEVTTVSNHAVKSMDEPLKEPDPKAKGPPLIIKLAVASLGVSILFYIMLFIYLGASSNQTAYTQNIKVAVASFDTGPAALVGQAFMQFASNVPAGNGLPSLQVCTESCAVNKFTRHNGDLHFPQRPTCFHPPLPHHRGAQAITGSSPSDLTNRVGNGEFWAALYVASGTSSSMMAAIGAANPNAYQPSRCQPPAAIRARCNPGGSS